MRNFLKALRSRCNISSNMTKMPCWMKCWISLTERKSSQKRKNHAGWRKIVLDENLIASKFFIQQNYHVGLVYSLFHPRFHSSDVTSKVRTSNFEWFNKIKTLCKIIAIKKSYTSNRIELDQQQRRFWPSI